MLTVTCKVNVTAHVMHHICMFKYLQVLIDTEMTVKSMLNILKNLLPQLVL